MQKKGLGSQSTLPWLQSSGPVRVAVIGDVILDEYLDGVVTRISPEAPVPVHLVKATTRAAGGAANVARNIQLAGGQAILLSVIGQDEPGRNLEAILMKDGVDTSKIVKAKDRQTIRKTRLTAGRQQIVRIDWEMVHPISKEHQSELLGCLKGLDCEAILVSDYAKGCIPDEFLGDVFKIAKKKGVPVVIDPKGSNYSKYREATVITPNRKEACDALELKEEGDWEFSWLAQRLHEKYGVANVLLTLGAHGMLLWDGKAPNGVHFQTVAREVFDVSGAGDTVAGILTLGMASGATLEEAVRISNLAAGRVVEKWGTQPITRVELEEELQRVAGGSEEGSRKVVSVEHLKQILGRRGHRGGQRIVFTNGCFDILHAGHVTYLEKARRKGDVLVVAVNSDRSVANLKGKGRPIFPLDERMRVLSGLGFVTWVTHFDSDTPIELIKALEPDVLIKGADYRPDQIVGAKEVLDGGGKVETIDLVEGVSTSAAVSRILGK